MMNKSIEIRFSRLFSGIGVILFAAATYLPSDFIFVGKLPLEPPPSSAAWMPWAFLIVFCLITLNCFKQYIFPNLIFACDSSEIRIGTGIVFNKVRHIPWRNVVEVSEGKVRLSKKNDVGFRHQPAMRIRFDALAIQDSGGGTGAFALGSADPPSEFGIEGFPGAIERPFAEDMIDGLPRWEVDGQQAPLDASFGHIEDGIYDPATIGGRSAPLAGFGQERLKQGPLGLGQTSVVQSDFHRSNRAVAWNGKRFLPTRKSRHHSLLSTSSAIGQADSPEIQCPSFFRQALRSRRPFLLVRSTRRSTR